MSQIKTEVSLPTEPESSGPVAGKSRVSSRARGQRAHAKVSRAIGEMGCYPPVESVGRALEILREVNRQRIATVRGLHQATGQNKSTIVRMLQTLIDAGYVVGDKLCGGYRTTSKVQELVSGYNAMSRLIDAARPLAVDLTERLNWPVGLGIVDGEAISLQLYTGAISPWSHSDGVLRMRPSLTSSAMGRAYLAFCSPEELKSHLERLTETSEINDSNQDELQRMLAQARSEGFAMRDPRIEPRRMTTIAMPIRQQGKIVALMSGSFYKTITCGANIVEYAVKPLAAVIEIIEKRISLEPHLDSHEQPGTDPATPAVLTINV